MTYVKPVRTRPAIRGADGRQKPKCAGVTLIKELRCFVATVVHGKSIVCIHQGTYEECVAAYEAELNRKSAVQLKAEHFNKHRDNYHG